VICHRGIPAHRIPFIEAAFSYGEHPVGVAGIVASSLRTVYIPDLADEQDENVRHWIRVEEGERKEGSLYCFPIRRGVGPHPQTNALAVLSLTSVRKNAFDTKVVPNYLSQIAPKLEALIYIMTLHC
jgi:hypothetical protein